MFNDYIEGTTNVVVYFTFTLSLLTYCNRGEKMYKMT